jgi:hypothetical protein
MECEDWDRRYRGTELVWTAQPNRFVVQEGRQSAFLHPESENSGQRQTDDGGWPTEAASRGGGDTALGLLWCCAGRP